jgi:hypothetical protein
LGMVMINSTDITNKTIIISMSVKPLLLFKLRHFIKIPPVDET